MTGLFAQIADQLDGTSWPPEVIVAFPAVLAEETHMETCRICPQAGQLGPDLGRAFAEGWCGPGSADIAAAIVELADVYRDPRCIRHCDR